MSSNDVGTNQNVGSDQKSDANKQQDQAGSGSDDPKQINGKNVVGKKQLVFLLVFPLFLHHTTRTFVIEIQQKTSNSLEDNIIISIFLVVF